MRGHPSGAGEGGALQHLLEGSGAVCGRRSEPTDPWQPHGCRSGAGAHQVRRRDVQGGKGLDPLSKAQFRVRFAEQLIGEVPAPPASVTGDGTHRLMTLEKNKKKFELGLGFAPAKAKYRKYTCRGCQQQVRTYGACSTEVIRCASCFGNHCRDS